MSEIGSLLPPLQQMKPVKGKVSDRKEWNKILKSQRSLDVTRFQMSSANMRSTRSYSLQEDTVSNCDSKSRRNSTPVGIPEVTLQPSSKNTSPLLTKCSSLKQTYTLLSPTALFGDQKLILRGCQTLETLSKILQQDPTEFEGDYERSTKHLVSDCQIRKCSYYHDKLKSLLKEQCLINLRKECIAHIQTAELFVNEVKEIVVKEYDKLKHILNTRKNSEIYETGAYLGSVRTLIEDLSSHSNLWPSLLTSVSRALDILHLGWNPKLEALLVQTHKILQKLELHALYWVRRILDIDFTIICLGSVRSVPSEDLQNMLQTFHNFNKLLKIDMKDSNSDYHLCNIHTYQRNSHCAMCQTKPFSFSLAIELLASWEAKASAKKLSYFLTAECDKLSIGKQENFKWISIMPESERVCSSKVNDTSDYYSATYSDVCCKTNNATMNATLQSTAGERPDLSDVLNGLIQDGQTLLLKFLFAIACVKIQPDKLSNFAAITRNDHDSQVSRQKWQIPKQRTSLENGTKLEQIYWHCFWQHIGEEIVFSLTNLSPPVSSLQNDSLLPLSFSSTAFQKSVLNLLQEFTPDNDISSKSKDVTKMVYNMLYAHICVMTWDERFCAALASSQLSRCVPVPLVEGAAGTNQGNLVCGSLEPLISSLLALIPANYYIKAQQVAVLLNCTSDFALRWAKEKRLGFLSSWNVSLYLLISCSDLELIAKCLQNLHVISWEEYPDITNSNIQLKSIWQEICDQISFLKNVGSHIYNEMNQKTYKVTLETFDQVMPPRSYWRKSRIGSKDNNYIQECTRTVLDASMQTLSHLSFTHQLVIGTALMGGFAHAWLDYIWNKKLRFSHSGGIQLCRDIDYIVDWLDHFPLVPEVKHKLLMVDHMRKLNRVAHVLSTSHPRLRRLSLTRNKVAPAVVTKVPLNTRYSKKKKFDAEPTNEEVDSEQWNSLVVTDHYALNGCICCFV